MRPDLALWKLAKRERHGACTGPRFGKERFRMGLGFTCVDRRIFFAGVLGLGAAVFAACGAADDGSTSSSAGAPSSAGNGSDADAAGTTAGAPATAACAA